MDALRHLGLGHNIGKKAAMRHLRLFRIGMTVVTLLVSSACAHAAADPTITAGEVDRVYTAMQENDWGRVEQEASLLIERSSHPQRHLIARLRYIYLFSLAIQIERKELAYGDVVPRLAKIEKRLLIQPWHPINSDASPCFNQICTDEDNQTVLVTTQANRNASQIYSFEYFDMGNPISIESFNGQNARLGGILDKIQINENLAQAEQSGSAVTWYFRLFVKDGFIDYQRKRLT